MGEKKKSGGTLVELYLEWLRNGESAREIRSKKGMSASSLNEALNRRVTEQLAECEENDRRLVELKAKLVDSEEKLVDSEISETEASISLGEVESRIHDVEEAKAKKEVETLKAETTVLQDKVTFLKVERRKAIEAAGATEVQLAEYASVKAG